MLGKATKSSAFDNRSRLRNFQHHPNDRPLRDKAVNEVRDSLIALRFDNGLVEARRVVTVDSVDLFNQMIWKVRAGVGCEIAPFGVAGYHKASFRKFLHDML